MKRTAMKSSRRNTGPDTRTRALVIERDGACQGCGSTEDLVVNHRRTGMGGHRPQTPEWLCAMCWLCNGALEASLTPYDDGLKLRMGIAPSEPLRDWLGRLWVLSPDGTRSQVSVGAA